MAAWRMTPKSFWPHTRDGARSLIFDVEPVFGAGGKPLRLQGSARRWCRRGRDLISRTPSDFGK